jgi:hypothetical protein
MSVPRVLSPVEFGTLGNSNLDDLEIFYGDMTMTFTIKLDRLAEFPESAPPLRVSCNHSIRNANVIDPVIVAAYNRQTKLILESALAAARDSIRSATDIVSRRGNATSDPFLRHHLLATAREVAKIDGIFEASLWPDEPGPPCFVRVLTSEIYKLERVYAERLGPINKHFAALNFSLSWTAEIIFRLIARALIYDAFSNAPCNTELSLYLRLDGEMLRFDIDGAGHNSELSLTSRIDRPKHFKLLLDALSGSLGSTPNGISVHIPITACRPLETADDLSSFKRHGVSTARAQLDPLDVRPPPRLCSSKY